MGWLCLENMSMADFLLQILVAVLQEGSLGQRSVI